MENQTNETQQQEQLLLPNDLIAATYGLVLAIIKSNLRVALKDIITPAPLPAPVSPASFDIEKVKEVAASEQKADELRKLMYSTTRDVLNSIDPVHCARFITIRVPPQAKEHVLTMVWPALDAAIGEDIAYHVRRDLEERELVPNPCCKIAYDKLICWLKRPHLPFVFDHTLTVHHPAYTQYGIMQQPNPVYAQCGPVQQPVPFAKVTPLSASLQLANLHGEDIAKQVEAALSSDKSLGVKSKDIPLLIKNFIVAAKDDKAGPIVQYHLHNTAHILTVPEWCMLIREYVSFMHRRMGDEEMIQLNK